MDDGSWREGDDVFWDSFALAPHLPEPYPTILAAARTAFTAARLNLGDASVEIGRADRVAPRPALKPSRRLSSGFGHGPP